MRNVLIIINTNLHTNIQSVDLNGYIRNFNGCLKKFFKKNEVCVPHLLAQIYPPPACICEWIIKYERLNVRRIAETAQGSIKTTKTYKRTTLGLKRLKSNLNSIFYFIKRSFIKIELKFDIWGGLIVFFTVSFCCCNILWFSNLFLIVSRFVLKVLPTPPYPNLRYSYSKLVY